MGIGPYRVRTGPAHHELEELVDQRVADPMTRSPSGRTRHSNDGLHFTAHLLVGFAPEEVPPDAYPRRWITCITGGLGQSASRPEA